MSLSFPKAQRLCSRKLTESLFAGSGISLSAYPLRAVFTTVAEESVVSLPANGQSVQVLVSVGKRKLKHAVDRNRAKRQVREAWRQNRDILGPQPGSTLLAIAFIWLSAEPQPSELVQRKMKNLLHRIAEQIQEQSTQPCNHQ